MTDPVPYTLPVEPFTLDELKGLLRSLEPQGTHTGNLGGLIANARMAATLRDYQRVLAENEALRADKERLVRAVVEMALPYEALRMDGESRKWIAPETWKHIVEVTETARAIVRDYNAAIDAARSGGEG